MPRVLSNRGREMTLLLTCVDFSEVVTILGDDDQPMDVTAATFEAKIRRFASDTGDPLAEFAVSIVDAESGTVRMELAAADIAALAFDRAKWSLRMTSGGDVSQPYCGNVYLTPDPSH